MKNMNPKKQRLISVSVAVAVGLLVALGQAAWAGSVTLPWTFTNGTIADANQVNQSFQALQTGVNDNDARIAALEKVLSSVLYDEEWSSWVAPPPYAPDSNYTVSSSAGTATDNVTGLVWQQTISASSFTWSGAKSYCSALNYGGSLVGWRLPTLIELETIVGYGAAYNPAINSNVFPGSPSEYFWTSTAYAGNSSYAWAVNFYDGKTYTQTTTTSYRVRCVR